MQVFDPTVDCATLVEVLRWRAQHQGDQRAFIFLMDGEAEDVVMTYAMLDQQARAIAARLQTLATVGDRALLLYQPGPDFVTAYMGCLYSGVIAIPVYPPHPVRLDRTLPKIARIVHDARPALALTTSSILNRSEAMFTHAPSLRTMHWLATDEVGGADAAAWQDPHVASDALAFLQYTSGSTMAPKGVMVSHGNLMYNLSLIQQYFAMIPNHDVAMAWLPPYHDMGLIGGILEPLYAGFPIVLMSPVSFLQRPIRWLQGISDYKVTSTGGPNFAYELCVQRISPEQRDALDLSCWELAFSGAEPVNHETLDRFTAYFAPCGFRREVFLPCYGLAEATLLAAGGKKGSGPVLQRIQVSAIEQHHVVVPATNHADSRTLVGCGKTLSGQQIVIADPETLRRCPEDRVGEIWLSGPSVAQGYWNQPEVSQRTFRAYLADTGEGPFLRTGDLGFLKDGELFVTGRIKDLIIIDGRNHYPQDIEWTVERCHASVRTSSCAAFSIDVDGVEQLVVAAEVEPRLRHGFEEVIRHVRRAVAQDHDLRIHDVVLVKAGSLPKTSSGKIRRFACRANYLDGTMHVLKASATAPHPQPNTS